VGQVELFGRRARNNAHPQALEELEMIVSHVIKREYKREISDDLSMPSKLIALAKAFRERLITLITHWLRVGYCQGNFNSDNCAAGGFTLDYGPFGFCELFEPFYQPWTGGGRHFSFLNQPAAAEINFGMFCTAIKPLLTSGPNADADALDELEAIRLGFSEVMQEKMETMWASKLGLVAFDADLFRQLLRLMIDTSVDYTVFFRELSQIPDDVSVLSKSFYSEPNHALTAQWVDWLQRWRTLALESQNVDALSQSMKRVNPKYIWREWLVVPAYQQAMKGDYSLVRELQSVLTNPYDEQSKEVEAKYYRLRPQEFFQAGGVTHYSCSS
jgi:uncharacterized protein YdiU (UPF0061 family)